MSVTHKFNKLTIEPEPQQNTDIDMEVAGTTASQKKTAGQKPKRSKKDKEVFTFVTVYYKHAGWSTEIYDTLREGLLEFVGEYFESAREKEKLQVLSLNDEDLLDRILDIGTNSDRHISIHSLIDAIVNAQVRIALISKKASDSLAL
jgi:hypothetical protein